MHNFNAADNLVCGTRIDNVTCGTHGRVSFALGVAGLAAAIVMLIEPPSIAAVVGVFAVIGFHFVAGWKLLRSAR